MKRMTVALMTVALLATTAAPASAGHVERQQTDLLTFADLSDLGTASLPPGVYTMWWVVWNTPEGCAVPHACSLVDMFDPEGDTGLAIGYGGGNLVRADGKLQITSHLREGSTLKGFPYAEFGAAGVSLTETSLVDSRHAEIHLVIRTHENPVPGIVRSQLRSFNGGCVYDPPINGSEPAYGFPGPNQCSDVYFAVFAATA